MPTSTKFQYYSDYSLQIDLHLTVSTACMHTVGLQMEPVTYLVEEGWGFFGVF